jgi:Tol biopolymer transport system component
MNVSVPCATPDGERLAYVSYKTKQVYVVRIDTRQTTQLTTTFGGFGPRTPVWSPDGKRLALAYFEKDVYRTSFHVLDTLTRQLVTIPTPPALAPNTWSPWSPDGTKLALGGMSQTIIVDASTDQPRITRDFPRFVEDLQWSPDGTRLAFTQWEDGKYCDDVYVIDLQSGARKRVSPWFLEYRCFHGPRWSPDSTKLAFLGYSSRGDMNPLPWPIHISDHVYIAGRDMSVRRVTDDLKQRNASVSWCSTPLALDAK